MNEPSCQSECEAALGEYIAHLHRVSFIIEQMKGRIRSKPLLGGTFGHGGFLLCSNACTLAGLDRVDYLVIEASTRFVIGWGDSKDDALRSARSLLRVVPTARLASEYQKHKQACEQRERESAEARQLIRAARQEERTRESSKVKSIPRRRQQIFDESKGKCHYCGTTLTLDGKWHIEHKMPKALGGGNEPGNLVASCAPCNHKKRDKTDIEFKAQLAKGGAA